MPYIRRDTQKARLVEVCTNDAGDGGSMRCSRTVVVRISGVAKYVVACALLLSEAQVMGGDEVPKAILQPGPKQPPRAG